MAQNLMLDPAKKDYIIVQGSPVPSDRVEEKAFIALMIPKNQWLYADAGDGSDLHLFKNVKRISSIEQLFASRSIQAITDQLIKNGDALDVSVQNLASSRTGTSNNISIVPNQKNISTSLGFNPV